MILLYHFKEKIKEVPKCLCGEFRQYHCYGYRPTCSNKKCIKKVREESKKKYCLEHYGVEFVTQLETMKEKSKSTCLERYGVDNSTKSKEIIQKRKQRNLEKFGVEEPISLKSVRGKSITDAERGILKISKSLGSSYIVLKSDRNFTYTIKCRKEHIFDICKGNLHTKLKSGIEVCNQCNEYIGSIGEQEVFDYIKSIYFGEISRSNRKLISPFEIDMVLEDLKLCIEFNGDYWHSTKVNDDRFYHLNKLNMCLSKGYRLLQIRECDWNSKKQDIKQRLFNLVNNILYTTDFEIVDGILKIDLSWYDDRLFDKLELIETGLPSLIESGQYFTWNCGWRTYKILQN
jgi:very-short-patch-repair endonuclease